MSLKELMSRKERFDGPSSHIRKSRLLGRIFLRLRIGKALFADNVLGQHFASEY